MISQSFSVSLQEVLDEAFHSEDVAYPRGCPEHKELQVTRLFSIIRLLCCTLIDDCSETKQMFLRASSRASFPRYSA